MHLNKIPSCLITQDSKRIPQDFVAHDESSPLSPYSIEQEIKTVEGHRIGDFNVSDTQHTPSHFSQLSLKQIQDEHLFSDGWERFDWSKNKVTSPHAESIPKAIGEKDSAQINASTLSNVKERQQIFERQKETEIFPSKSKGNSWPTQDFKTNFETTSATEDGPSRPNQPSRAKEGESVKKIKKKETMQPGRSDSISPSHDSKSISGSHDDKPNHFNQSSGKKEGEAVTRHRKKERMRQSSLYSTSFAQDSKINPEVSRAANDTPSYYNVHSIVKGEEEVEGRQEKTMQPNRSDSTLTSQEFLILAKEPSATEDEIVRSSSHPIRNEITTVFSQERKYPSSLDGTTFPQGSKRIPRKPSATNDEQNKTSRAKEGETVDKSRKKEKMQLGRSDSISSSHDSKSIPESHDDKPNHFNQSSRKREEEAVMQHQKNEKKQLNNKGKITPRGSDSSSTLQVLKYNPEIPGLRDDVPCSHPSSYSTGKKRIVFAGHEKKETMQPSSSDSSSTLQDFQCISKFETTSATDDRLSRPNKTFLAKGATATVRKRLKKEKMQPVQPGCSDSISSLHYFKSVPESHDSKPNHFNQSPGKREREAVTRHQTEKERMMQSSLYSTSFAQHSKTNPEVYGAANDTPSYYNLPSIGKGGYKNYNTQHFRDCAKRDKTDNWSSETDHLSSVNSKEKYKRVKLDPNSHEFKVVEQKFRNTMTNDNVIHTIERVQNPFQWERYCRQKKYMENHSPQNMANEKQLFHGTKEESVQKICKNNFDVRLSGKCGHLFGYGIYFARDASYSHCYVKGEGVYNYFMFLTQVLVGSYTKGQSTYQRPPAKEPSNPESDPYDSCVDDTTNPKVFAIFDSDQCYPQYIIQYYTLEKCPILSPYSANLKGANATAPGYTQRNLANSGVYKSSLNTRFPSSLPQIATTSRNSQGIYSTNLGVPSTSLEAERGLASSPLSLYQLNTTPTNSEGVSTKPQVSSQRLSSQRELSISTKNILSSLKTRIVGLFF